MTDIRLLSAIICVIVASNAFSRTSASDSLRNNASPLLSASSDSSRALSILRSRLTALLTAKAYRSSQVSACVLDMSNGRTLFDLNGSTALTPASTTKLFSTAAFFTLAGKGAAVTTEVRTDGSLTGDGTVHGNLYLIGNGDAFLSTTDLEYLADRLSAMGIRRITGTIYGDGSRFDDVADRSRYSGDGEHVQPLPPIRPLLVNDGMVSVVVSAARNGRVSAQTVPSSSSFIVNITGSGTARGKRGRRTRCSINASTRPDGTMVFTIAGSPGAGRSLTKMFSVSNPALAAAAIFRSRLTSGGISVDGGAAERAAPSSATILRTFRRPFADIASVVNKRSHNYYAEHVFMMTGSLCGEYHRTADRAKRAMVEILDSLRVPALGCRFNDGSGLSRRNSSSAVTQARLLRAIARQSWGPEYRATLSIAGRDGTLRRRMVGTAAENNCVGKTGTLRNVSALSGYVRTADGTDLAFAFISNGPNVGAYKATENLAVSELAAFRWNPRAASTEPVAAPDENVPMPDEGLDSQPDESLQLSQQTQSPQPVVTASRASNVSVRQAVNPVLPEPKPRVRTSVTVKRGKGSTIARGRKSVRTRTSIRDRSGLRSRSAVRSSSSQRRSTIIRSSTKKKPSTGRSKRLGAAKPKKRSRH